MPKNKYLQKVKRKRFLIVAVGIILLLFVIILSIIFLKQFLELQSFKNDRDLNYLKDKLSRHMVLPPDDPIVASVTDADKLKSEQSFYKNVENGDKVFIWKDKALIYRPSTDKIVDFGIIVNSNTNTSSTPALTVTPEVSKARVAVINGSKSSSAAQSVSDTLSKNTSVNSSIVNISTLNAKNTNYSDIQVIDLSGKFDQLSQNIINVLGGAKVKDFPASETKPENTDIVIIVGNKK